MVYTAEHDPLCYPGSNVLINEAGLTDAQALEQFELGMFLTRAEDGLPAGNLTYDHYLAIHRHLFQDVYSWAGQPRDIRIGKGGNWFCYPEYIDVEMRRIFSHLEQRDFLRNMPSRDFSDAAASIIADINAVHPFREGNGRTQLAFLAILAENAGFDLADDGITREAVIPAMIASFSGSEKPLAILIESLISRPAGR